MNPTAQKPLLKCLVCVLLAAITFAVYAGVTGCSFIALDDWVYVVDNPGIRHGFSWSAIHWAFNSVYAGYWIPVTWLIHAADCQFYGIHPAGHHVTNLVFHIANTVLVFLLFEKMTAKLWPSAFVALLFGIHPMHVESVVWVAELKDVVSAFFFLLTLLAYTHYAKLQLSRDAGQTQPPSATLNPRFRWLAYSLTLVFFTLGLMSKPMLVTLPFVLLLLDFWPLNRFGNSAIRIRQSAFEKLPFFLLAAVFSYITFLSQRIAGAVKPTFEYPVAERLGHVAVSFAWYLLKLFWPVNLSVFDQFHKTADTPLKIVLASVLLLAVTVFALARARKNPYILFGWLWFLGMLFPVIGFVQSGDQAYADRFAYLPYIGLSIIIAWGVPDLLAKMRVYSSSKPSVSREGIPQPAILHPPSSTFLWAAAALVAVACAWRTVVEVGYWKDGLTLLTRAVKLDPNNETAWGSLGFEYEIRKDMGKAIDCTKRSLSVNSRYYPSWNYLGHLLTRQSDYAGAENAYQTALPLIWYKTDRVYAYKRLAEVYVDEQKYPQAVTAYESAIALDPTQAATETKLGNCLLQTKQPDAAAAAFQTAISLQPTNADAYVGLGMIAQGAGIDSEAIAQYRSALKADPDTVLALNNLAWILAADSDPSLRNGPEAVALAERACQLTDNQEAVYIGTLAAAYAEAGRFDAAVATAQKAHDVAIAHGDSHHAERNAQLMELYKSHRAYHAEAAQVKAKD